MIMMRPHLLQALSLIAATLLSSTAGAEKPAERLQRISYNHPGLTVDLGVGLWAWPLPMDYDNDGDNDLVVVCPDYPYSGTYFFENPGGSKNPIFKPGVKIANSVRNVQVSYHEGSPRVLSPGVEYRDFLNKQFSSPVKLSASTSIHSGKIRANQWKYVDYDHDGRLDILVGVGDWKEYGWDDAFDSSGHWTRGPLHGYVYLLRNLQSNEKPSYAKPVKLAAAGKAIDVYGMPSPNMADFDGDGDLDLICGEFLDGFTYFKNIGSRAKPVFAAGEKLRHKGRPIRMDLQMITPTAFDWDGDGDIDLICGDEDGRVAWIENSGKLSGGLPRFSPPHYFKQQADEVKFGALATPVSFDWDGDGDEDLICGNTAGYIGFIENLDGGDPPKWATPKYLQAAGKTLRIQAGENGSIQGPCEAKWGYTTLSACDWDHDGLPDLVVNSIVGKIIWYQNIGSRKQPQLAAAAPIEVAWTAKPPKPAWNWWSPKGDELATQWRTTPQAIDFNNDGLTDLVMLDHEGYLAFYQRQKKAGQLSLSPPRRIFQTEGPSQFGPKHDVRSKQPGLLRLNAETAGRSGRRKFCLADWDGDGRLDLLVNSRNVNVLRNVSGDSGSRVVFKDLGQVDGRILAGHTTSPTTVDWNRDGLPDLLVGGEDGYFYFLKNPKTK